MPSLISLAWRQSGLDRGHGIVLLAAFLLLGVVLGGYARTVAGSLGLEGVPVLIAHRYELILFGGAAIVAMYLVVVGIAGAHEAGWLVPLFARVPSRVGYVLAQLVVGATVSTVAFLASAVSFGIAAELERTVVRQATLFVPLLAGVLAFGAFAALVSVVIRRATASVLVLVTLFLLPLVLSAFLGVAGDRSPLGSYLLPPFSLELGWRTQARALAYSGGVLLMALALAPRLLGRHG